ncbi:MAG TPA: hypothetical protein VEV44_14535 [Pseudoneobacillus sp.]|nr:hypothetical protein [Pseudoneobacillus sp.]
MKTNLFILLLMCLFINGCSQTTTTSAPKEKQETQPIPEEIQNAASMQTNTEEAQEDKTTETAINFEVQLDHLKINVSDQWSINQGLDSVSFILNEKPIGGIEGLGYSDSIEELVPNHNEIVKKIDLKNTNVKATEVLTKTDSLDGTSKEEVHVFLFINQKVVYDLHFDLNEVDKATILSLVETAIPL